MQRTVTDWRKILLNEQDLSLWPVSIIDAELKNQSKNVTPQECLPLMQQREARNCSPHFTRVEILPSHVAWESLTPSSIFPYLLTQKKA